MLNLKLHISRTKTVEAVKMKSLPNWKGWGYLLCNLGSNIGMPQEFPMAHFSQL